MSPILAIKNKCLSSMHSLGHVHLFSVLKLMKKRFQSILSFADKPISACKQSYFCSKTNMQWSKTPTIALKLMIAILKNFISKLVRVWFDLVSYFFYPTWPSLELA